MDSGSNTGFGISSLIELYDLDTEKHFKYYSATQTEAVKNRVAELAEILKRYGDKALHGDPEIFRKLEQSMDHYWDDRRARQIRPDAEEAFRSGDYQEAAILYASMGQSLSPTERKKLEFAKERAVASQGCQMSGV